MTRRRPILPYSCPIYQVGSRHSALRPIRTIGIACNRVDLGVAKTVQGVVESMALDCGSAIYFASNALKDAIVIWDFMWPSQAQKRTAFALFKNL